MRVKSICPLSDAELRQITAIMSESNCPHESLRATFGYGYNRYDEEQGIIYFGRHSYDFTYEIPAGGRRNCE